MHPPRAAFAQRVIAALAAAALLTGLSVRGGGENTPSVQSAFGGSHYVRTVPAAAMGSAGKTQVFRVRSEGDELLDEYPVYMRGELHLGWSPSAGKYAIVHVEPERITSSDDYAKLGKVTSLTFYLGGRQVATLGAKQLEQLGLRHKVTSLVHRQPGQFVVHGIRQVPQTNDYVLDIEKAVGPGATETLSFDITTGRPVPQRGKPAN
jgi:hypothetical protein